MALVGLFVVVANDSFAQSGNGYWARVDAHTFEVMFTTEHCWRGRCITRLHNGVTFAGQGQGRNVQFKDKTNADVSGFNWQGNRMHQMVLDTSWSLGCCGRITPSNFSAEMWFTFPCNRSSGSSDCGNNIVEETSMSQQAEVSDPVPGLLSAYDAEQVGYEIIDYSQQYELEAGFYIIQHTYQFDSVENAQVVVSLLQAGSENGVVHRVFEDGEAVAMHTVQENGVMILTQASSMSIDQTLSALESAIGMEQIQIPTNVGLFLNTVSTQQVGMVLLPIIVVFLISITLKTSTRRES